MLLLVITFYPTTTTKDPIHLVTIMKKKKNWLLLPLSLLIITIVYKCKLATKGR